MIFSFLALRGPRCGWSKFPMSTKFVGVCIFSEEAFDRFDSHEADIH
jgi:hypothetical protein